MATCPNCHQPVTPSDDICENCGAVLSTLISVPTFVAAPTQPPVASASGSSICPNCKASTRPQEDICEQCGMVLAATALDTIPTPLSPIPTLSGVSSPSMLGECPHCHKPRQPGKKFCGSCGFNLETNAGGMSGPIAPPSHAAAPQLVVGSVLNNKYKLLKEIGAGGMGAVYLAEDQVLKRQVVIKALLSDDDPDLVAQSVKEREFLAAIKHASIVSIYDFLAIGSQGYIVMEYVQGKTLDQLMEDRGRPFDVPEAITHILGILPAFTYLAKLNLVYCDFKPANVMLEVLKDGTQMIKLIDLGTVIQYEPHPKDVYGTHGFFAREAVKTPSPQTDLYSICRTLAYLVTDMDLAQPLFGLPSSEHYQAFRDYPALYRLLAKGTHTDPRRRFQHAEELGDQLAGVLRQIVGGTPGEPVGSKLFVAGMLTTTGKLGLRGEAVLDETDPALDQLRYGDQALRGGNYSSATIWYKQALKANSKGIDAHLRLAEACIDLGEYTQALAQITQVQCKVPGHWKVIWYTGRLLEAQGHLSAAADQYRELVADLPGELPPQQALARVSARQGDDTAAVKHYGDVLKADPGNTEAILGVTDSLLNLQRWDEAAKILSSVNEAAARYIDAQLLLCELYIRRMTPLTLPNLQRAAEAVQSLAGRTEDPRYYLARGDVYRAAWQAFRTQPVPPKTTIAGVPNPSPRALSKVAEESYIQYLRRTEHPANREEIVRRRFEVAPWSLI